MKFVITNIETKPNVFSEITVDITPSEIKETAEVLGLPIDKLIGALSNLGADN